MRPVPLPRVPEKETLAILPRAAGVMRRDYGPKYRDLSRLSPKVLDRRDMIAEDKFYFQADPAEIKQVSRERT
jgi:hypothetical protein